MRQREGRGEIPWLFPSSPPVFCQCLAEASWKHLTGSESLGNAAYRGPLPATQSRAGKGQFLVLFSLPSLFSSVIIWILLFLTAQSYIAKALLPCQKIFLSFLSSYPVLIVLAHSALLQFLSLTSAPFGSGPILLLLLCAAASPHLSGYSSYAMVSLQHAQVSQGLWVERKSVTQDTLDGEGFAERLPVDWIWNLKDLGNQDNSRDQLLCLPVTAHTVLLLGCLWFPHFMLLHISTGWLFIHSLVWFWCSWPLCQVTWCLSSQPVNGLP